MNIQQEKQYHKLRRMFFLIDGKLVLPEKNCPKSHKEWLETNKYTKEEVQRIINTQLRGVLNPDGNIRFYVGENWEINQDIEKKFFEILPELIKIFELGPEVKIEGGAIKQEVGVWPARKEYGYVKNYIIL
jgi:hypothetical protein